MTQQPQTQPPNSSSATTQLVEKGLSIAQANWFKAFTMLVFTASTPLVLRLADQFISQEDRTSTSQSYPFDAEAFSRIQPDKTTLLEAQVLLGPGIEISSSASTALYKWQGPSGTVIFGKFENGVLVHKYRQ